MPSIQLAKRPVAQTVAGSATVPLDTFQKRLGPTAYQVWASLCDLRDAEGSTHITRKGIARRLRTHGLTDGKAKAALAKLDRLGLVVGDGHIDKVVPDRALGCDVLENVYTRKVYGALAVSPTRKVVQVPSAVFVAITKTGAWGGARPGAGRKPKAGNALTQAALNVSAIREANSSAGGVAGKLGIQVQEGSPETGSNSSAAIRSNSSGPSNNNIYKEAVVLIETPTGFGRGRAAPPFSRSKNPEGQPTPANLEPAPTPAPAPTAPPVARKGGLAGYSERQAAAAAQAAPGTRPAPPPTSGTPQPAPAAPSASQPASPAKDRPAPGTVYARPGGGLAIAGGGAPVRRWTRGATREVPPSPAKDPGLDLVTLPPPPKLDPEAKPRAWAEQLARAYRGAVEKVTGRRCFVLAKGDITKAQDYQRLVRAARAMLDHDVEPAAWVMFSLGVWNERVRPGSGSTPPLRWVFSDDRIHKHAGWFRREFGDGLRGKTVCPPPLRELLYKHQAMSTALLRAQTPAEADRVIERYFPGDLYERMATKARKAVQEEALALRTEVEQGRWIW